MRPHVSGTRDDPKVLPRDFYRGPAIMDTGAQNWKWRGSEEMNRLNATYWVWAGATIHPGGRLFTGAPPSRETPAVFEGSGEMIRLNAMYRTGAGQGPQRRGRPRWRRSTPKRGRQAQCFPSTRISGSPFFPKRKGRPLVCCGLLKCPFSYPVFFFSMRAYARALDGPLM